MEMNYGKEMGNVFNRILNPNLATATDNLNKVITDFFNNGGGVIECACPSCGKKINLDCYDKDTNDFIKTETYLCDNCNTYIDAKIIIFENDYRILLKKYDHFEDIGIKYKTIRYLADNLSIDDWKIIFSNVDLTDKNNENVNLLIEIKNILKNNGVVFDDENNSDKGE